MGIQTKSLTEDCPFCFQVVIFRKQSGYIEHLRQCPLRDSQQEISVPAHTKKEMPHGPLMARAYKKILGFSRANAVNANRKKFAEEWSRIDDFWKKLMIVCPECFSSKIPADEKVRLCPDCKCMMEWAKELVENDPRFNFAKEFCAGD